LALPRSLLDQLPPRPSGYGRTRELFPRYTGSTFDAITPAVVAADHVVSNILNAQRAARIVQQHALDPALPSLDEALDALFAATFDVSPTDPYEAEIGRAVERVVIDRLIGVAQGASMPQVRAIVTLRLERTRDQFAERVRTDRIRNQPTDAGRGNDAHFTLLARDIARFLERPAAEFSQPTTMAAPPGAPIGEPAMDWLRRLEPACSW
jgi:hypothetical protein